MFRKLYFDGPNINMIVNDVDLINENVQILSSPFNDLVNTY